MSTEAVIDETLTSKSAQSDFVRIALAGNPNCGKSTVFNAYTGARQHVGNYPGVTVDRKEGRLDVDGKQILLVDLPGTYSLTAYSQEELVARRELANHDVRAVINVVESSALERNLLLTVQLLEMGLPVVLACNMMDEARAAGIHIDTGRLSELLGMPVVPTVGRSSEGLDSVMREALRLAESSERIPLRISYGQDLDGILVEMERRIEAQGLLVEQYSPRWTAVKILEADSEILGEARAANAAACHELEALSKKAADHVRVTLNISPEALITDHRYGYIRSLLRDGIVRQDPGMDRLALTDKLDKVLTNALLGPLIMVGVLFLVFQLTFTLGAYPQGWLEEAFGFLGEFLSGILPDGLFRSLLVDGIIAGVGGIVSFVPLILIMFALISFMEDSGYMARVAYMMDRIFRFFGLHGASVMPYIISGGIAGGCAIPGVMATRTLRSPKEKLATLLTLPYMTCGAKLPVFLLLVGAFFPESAALTMFLVTLSGWVAALLVARLLRSSIVKGDATPFVMELPPYRLPTFFSVLLHCWERAWMYLKKAGTVLVAISVVIWASLTFPALSPQINDNYFQKTEQLQRLIAAQEDDSAQKVAFEEQLADVSAQWNSAKLQASAAGSLGRLVEPLTAPAGLDWRTDIALIAGIAAKEAVVSTMGTAYSLSNADPDDPSSLGELLKKDPNWSKASALSLMLFVLLYSPCFVALVVIRREAGSWGWMFFSMFFNTAVAYGVAVGAYQVGRLVWG